jgi:hypothetical protein
MNVRSGKAAGYYRYTVYSNNIYLVVISHPGIIRIPSY